MMTRPAPPPAIAYACRVALLGRIRRALRALNSGRMTGATFDQLAPRWESWERETYRAAYYTRGNIG